MIDGTGADPQPDTTVLLAHGKVAAVVPSRNGSGLPNESEVERIDLHGMFVTPGLIDCHVHLTGVDLNAARRDAFRKYIEPYASVRILRAATEANRLLRAGYTTVRHLGHGDPAHAQALKQAIKEGLVAGPRMFTCGWAMSQTGGHGNLRTWPYDLVETLRPRSSFCDGVDACRKFVRRQVGDGAEWIKIYTTEGVVPTPDRQIDFPNYTLAEVDAITDEAHRLGARVAAHATALEGAKTAVVGGVDTLEHGPHAPDEDLLDLLKANATAFVPTLSVFEFAATEGRAHTPAWVADRANRWLPGRRAMANEAMRRGITVATGSDTARYPGGGRNAMEMTALVNAGLTPLQAVTSATSSAAKALRIDDAGALVPGRRADLVVLGRDPIRDISAFLDPGAIRLVVKSSTC